MRLISFGEMVTFFSEHIQYTYLYIIIQKCRFKEIIYTYIRTSNFIFKHNLKYKKSFRSNQFLVVYILCVDHWIYDDQVLRRHQEKKTKRNQQSSNHRLYIQNYIGWLRKYAPEYARICTRICLIHGNICKVY